MKKLINFKARSTAVALLFIIIALSAILFVVVFADGTEELGPPSISIASGTGFVASGTGLESLPGIVNITVPSNSTVQQVLLYWVGGTDRPPGPGDSPGGDDNTATINGHSVTGTRIGGPTVFYGEFRFYAYRADITNLGIVQPGNNSLVIDDLFFGPEENNGAGLLVIYDDGSVQSEIQIRDGLDLAFRDYDAPHDSTVPQIINFAPASVDRSANLAMFFAGVPTDGPRPNSIEITIDGNTTVYSDLLASNDGPRWDTVNLPSDPLLNNIIIPAGTTSLTVQAFSRDDSGNNIYLPASFSWVTVALNIPPPTSIGDRVWFDDNSDGVQDTGEVGYPKYHR